jgi:hypothetical protein
MRIGPGSSITPKDGEPAVRESEKIALSDRKEIYNPKCQTEGLCAHCDCRESCLIPTTDGGIWHCEQYK